MSGFKGLVLGLVAVVSTPAGAGQLDIGTFINLRRGMLESEVLFRAGPPDLVTYPDGAVVSDRGYDDSGVYELHYIPGPEEHDPQLTVVTVSHGRVSALERRKIVAPAPGVPPSPPAIGREVAPSDIEIRRERAQRTLEAAEEYAHVRARIKERGVEAAPGAGGTVYRGTGGAGDAYFGDVPLPDGPGSEK